MKTKIALFFASLILSIAAMLAVAHLAGINVGRQLLYLQTSLFGPIRVGIWQEDSRKGWEHLPNSVGQQSKPLVYDVTYHIDSQGHRVTAGTYDRPKILLLGGSFTFGQGVEDQEAFPALLGEAYPEVKVINGGVSAWGTGQALLELEEELATYDDIELVVYGFITAHLERNSVRRSWLQHLAKTRNFMNPRFELEGETLIYQGLADPVRDGMDAGPELERQEFDLTMHMLAEMKSLAEAAAVPFVVVFLPDGADDPLLSQAMAETVGDGNFYDLRKLFSDPDAHLRFDGHPSPLGHRLIAEAMTPIVKNRLKRLIEMTSRFHHRQRRQRGDQLVSHHQREDLDKRCEACGQA